MRYEVRDIDTGNCVGQFDDEAAAKAWMHKLIAHFGAEHANSFALGFEDQRADEEVANADIRLPADAHLPIEADARGVS